jgi:antibiotic biosynthesis monooxygenase (ABM) superfamily enzyme
MTKAERLAAVFAIAFAVIYAPTMDLNWTLATYHPLQGVWEWFKAPPKGGGSPAMYWYGFVFTAGLFGLVVAGLAALVPDKLMERVPWSTLSWIVTLCSIAYICYVLLPYATKT